MLYYFKALLFVVFLSFVYLFPKPSYAAGGILDVSISSSNGYSWTVVIGNSDGSVPAGSSRTLSFHAFWCNQTGDSSCDDNNLDYRGLKTEQTLTVTAPSQGQTTTITPTLLFGINTRAGYQCGTVQGDIGQGSSITGNLVWASSNCPTTASLVQKPSACALQANWGVGFNDNANCQIKIEAGGTLYQLNDRNCSSSWDSSVNPIPSGLSVHNGGIYKLHAGTTSTGSVTLSCPTPTPTASPTSPQGGQVLKTDITVTDASGNVISSCSDSSTTTGNASVGQNLTWTTIPRGGNFPFNYSWSGAVTGTTSSITKNYSTSGTLTGSVTTTDSSSPQLQATRTCSVNITNTPPTGSNLISTPTTPVQRASNTSSWIPSSFNISVTVNKTPTGNVFYKKASNITPGPCPGPCDGWTSIKEDVSTSTFAWSSPLGLTDGEYAFGLFTSSNNELLAVSYTSFFTGSTPTPTTTTSPTCKLEVSSSNASTGSIINITSTNPNTPYRITVDGPQSMGGGGFGPYTSPTGTATWYTSGWQGGPYTVSNGCASKTVNLTLSCSTDGSFQATIQTFLEPKFESTQWPQQIFNPNYADRYYCYSGDEGSSTEGVSTYRPLPEPTLKNKIFQFFQKINLKISISPVALATHQGFGHAPNSNCSTDADCNTSPSANLCRESKCVFAESYLNGLPTYQCQQVAKPYGTQCGTTSNGQNLYCGDWTQCYKTPTLSYCSGSPDARGVCSVQQCSTNADCDDNNPCTEEGCGGGTCSRTNKLPTTVCQTDGSGNPLKLCSQGFGYNGKVDHRTGKISYSTCSVDYIACSDVRTDPSSNPACCGLDNIQGRACQGWCQKARFPTSWNNDSTLPFNGPPNDFPVQPLEGAAVNITDNRGCGLNYTLTTNSSGLVTINLPRKYADSRIRYTVKVTPPNSNMIFTRGVDAIDKNDWEAKPGRSSYQLYPYDKKQPSYDSLDSGGSNQRVTFGFESEVPLVNEPWIQTSGGNVHSNDRIKSENGP